MDNMFERTMKDLDFNQCSLDGARNGPPHPIRTLGKNDSNRSRGKL